MASSLIFELCFGVIVAGSCGVRNAAVPSRAIRFGRSGARSDERMTP